MGSNCVRRTAAIRDMLASDLEPIIVNDFTKTYGYACAFVFNNLFEECWKLMKELLVGYFGYNEGEQYVGGPKNCIKTAYEAGLIGTERWLKMLQDRNSTTHDYRNNDLENYYERIKNEYVVLVKELLDKAEKIISEETGDKETDI
ncbi:MAG: nucleotidyltransferase substrate binding protein [Ruminiclostridium sp.]|nr:nucleotidyltransferase substrate binding protein [Ruminiclostridium sp.]